MGSNITLFKKERAVIIFLLYKNDFNLLTVLQNKGNKKIRSFLRSVKVKQEYIAVKEQFEKFKII